MSASASTFTSTGELTVNLEHMWIEADTSEPNQDKAMFDIRSTRPSYFTLDSSTVRTPNPKPHRHSSVNWEQYLGLPYAPAGRSVTKDGGIDCWGLLRLVYQSELGIDIDKYHKLDFDFETARRNSEEELLIRGSQPDWYKVCADMVRPLDCVVINIGRLPLHVGVVVDEKRGLMLNSRSATQESVIEHYTSFSWKNRIRGFYRHKEAQ